MINKKKNFEIQQINAIRLNILQWFYKNRENYSFRNNRTPYRVWISETILQQTRMNAALEKMEIFLQHFPDIYTLANADEEDVLKAFKGLGYYNRARNLHKGARFILNRYENLPSEYDQLLEVPSIGPYTAAAISSICYGKNIPVIDGNIKRIFARIFQLEAEINDRQFLEQLKTILFQLFNDKVTQPGDLNEGLMEFGQKICKVKNPQCQICALNTYCLSNNNNDVFKYPIIKRKKNKKSVNWKFFFFINNNRVLLNRFKDFYLLKNHVGFPSVIEIDQKTIYSTNGILFEKYLRNHNLYRFEPGTHHTITDHQIHFMYCIINLNENEANNENDGIFWCTFEEVANHLVSSGFSKTWNNALSKIIARGGT